MKASPFAKSLRRNMTDAERWLWRSLRAHRLSGEKFRRQVPMGAYVVDFVHFGARVVVEADGGQHNESAADAVRDAWLKQQGFRVLRFWNDEIFRNTEGVLAAIWAAVDSDAPSPPTPLPQGERGVRQEDQPLSRKGRGGQARGPAPHPQGERGSSKRTSPAPAREEGN